MTTVYCIGKYKHSIGKESLLIIDACYFLGSVVPLFLHLVDGEEVTQVRDFEMNVFTFRNDV